MKETVRSLSAVRNSLEVYRPLREESSRRLQGIMRILEVYMADEHYIAHDDPFRLSLLSKREFDRIRSRHEALLQLAFDRVEESSRAWQTVDMRSPMPNVMLDGVTTYQPNKHMHCVSLTTSDMRLQNDRSRMFKMLSVLGGGEIKPTAQIELPLSCSSAEVPSEAIERISAKLPVMIELLAVETETPTTLVAYEQRSA